MRTRIFMHNNKPKYGVIGTFQKGGSNLFGILSSWGKYGAVEVYLDRIVIKRGLFWTRITDEIPFGDVISARTNSLAYIGSVGVAPWIEIEYRSKGKAQKIEFTSNRGGEIGMLQSEIEKMLKIKKNKP